MLDMLDRLITVWRSRGPRGFFRFLRSRIFSYRRDLIFDTQIAEGGAPPRWDGAGAVIFISCENLDRDFNAQLAGQLAKGEGSEYVLGLHGRDLLVAVVDESGDVLHHSFILFDTRTKVLLNESMDIPLFAHCATRTDARGRHLYPMALRYGLGVLSQRGHRRAVINCDSSNLASIKGIEHAGFCVAREVRTWLVGSRLGLQVGHHRTGGRILRIFFG
jgi:hypothetical protein